ncbi:MAG TPA: GNAT family N-acetyltransferase [Defluviitaleaceae bacterium]|jgi:ribosomal protein S18 acetylase RimI-like enzyme|nr:GNAT family N-acetyltransferase [Defluviitaleaceae bacterium]HPT77468.1 GNAT family N-acetyltransferase [Defluviitaleaceae bacterium]HQD51088.1 GNAT family N-acetyltransferase [Defluviitaleaceae bacterium]
MNMLYIIDGYRGKGIGKKLVSYWEEKMRQEGYHYLMTSTLANEEAQHFYRKLGYKDIGGFLMPNEPLEIMLIKVLS